LQNVAPHRKFRAGLALIPLSTDPDGIRRAPGGVRTASDGSGWLLVGPATRDEAKNFGQFITKENWP